MKSKWILKDGMWRMESFPVYAITLARGEGKYSKRVQEEMSLVEARAREAGK